MKSKADLTVITNNHKERKQKVEQQQKEIKNAKDELQKQINVANNLTQSIQSQKGELRERDSTIREKEKRIEDLKKKTQELEKFKFVLDYKIKELKREIGPREMTIEKLNEQKNKM